MPLAILVLDIAKIFQVQQKMVDKNTFADVINSESYPFDLRSMVKRSMNRQRSAKIHLIKICDLF